MLNRKPSDGDYVKNWCEFAWCRGARRALELLSMEGARLIVITNQRGVALGVVKRRDLAEIHTRMQAALRRHGVRLAAIYVCPHDRGQCACRKPGVGLLLKAKRAFRSIDFAQSFVIGDSPSDIRAGKRLGCHTIFIAAAGAARWDVRASHWAPTLLEAIRRFVLPTVTSYSAR